MTPNLGRVCEVFTEAIGLPIVERTAFLDRVCAGDEALRGKLEALLKSNDRAGGFLEDPVAAEMGANTAKIMRGESPGDQVDRYRLLQQIGEGGCGIVFAAEQEQPVRRRVALKVVKPGMDSKSVIARFEAERQALALMDHPNIARVLDAGTTGRPYFVMELVEGVKITDYCDRNSLATTARLELFALVCEAIQHAHQKGIIHRDIKPSNVLVTTGADGKPVPKVIDFGIAKAIAGQQLTDKTIFTAREMLIGTPAYMSPEQAALGSTEVDTRTDIYSLGVLLYELLTGSTPFDTRELLKAGFDEVRRVIRDEEPVRPSTRLSTMLEGELVNFSKHFGAAAPKLIREMRGDLDWIVMKSLEKDPARRFATANGLAMDIGRYISGEAVLARPPSTGYKLQKLFLRNRAVFIGLGMIVLLLIFALTMTTRLVISQRRELKLLDAIKLETKAFGFVRDSNPDAAEALLRESMAIRKRYHGGEPSAASTMFILDGLFGMRKNHEAEKLLDDILTPEALTHPENSELMLLRAELSAQAGRWESAATDARWLVKFEPGNSSRYHLLAPLLVAAGNLSAYQELCTNILARFKTTTNVGVADQMAKDCLILPTYGVDLKAVAGLANLAVTQGKIYGAYHFFQCCNALAQYRLGNYPEASHWAVESAKNPFPHSQAEALAILSMAQYKLGKAESARQAFTNCTQVIESKLPAAGQALGSDWRDWIIAHMLQKEADTLINHGPP